MADTIGPVTLQRVNGFSKNGRAYTIQAEMASQILMQGLEELCRDADVGSALHRIGGGKTKGEDLTMDDAFTQFCAFDDPEIPDGWYIIRTPVKRTEDGPVFWSLQVTLFFLGTNSNTFGPGLEISDVAVVTNDWSI